MHSAHVGVFRDSMLANPLLRRPALGATQSRGMYCPGPDFVYGAATTTRDGGVAEALSSWYVHSVPNVGAVRRPVEPDFVSLNREGVKSGLVTAKELSQYRAQQTRILQQDHNTNTDPRKASGTRGPNRHGGIPDITFGIVTRASSPISELLSQRYAQRWLEEQQARSRALTQKHINKPKLGFIPDTRTTLLRKSRPLPETPSLWKLARFTQVPPALDTFRDPQARRRAFRAHHSDCVSRKETQGLGTNTLD